jgi:hypothetical protein
MTVAASFIARDLGQLSAQAMSDVEIRLGRLFGFL